MITHLRGEKIGTLETYAPTLYSKNGLHFLIFFFLIGQDPSQSLKIQEDYSMWAKEKNKFLFSYVYLLYGSFSPIPEAAIQD